MLERFNGLPMAMQLSYVEVPPPYGGDTLSSTAVVSTSGAITYLGIVVNLATIPSSPNVPDLLWMNMIRIGDSVRLGYKGPLYTIFSAGSVNQPGQVIPTAPSSSTPWQLVNSFGVTLNLPPAYANGVPFQIIRQPVRSSATPLQLPEGTVVDLICSGMNAVGTFASLTTDPTTWPTTPPVAFNPVIMFSPNGRVDTVSNNLGVPIRATGPMYLLVGRRDLMADVTTSGYDENLYDPKATPENAYLSNFWVTIAHQTGQVSVAENARTVDFTDITNARVFAQTPQSAGGR